LRRTFFRLLVSFDGITCLIGEELLVEVFLVGQFYDQLGCLSREMDGEMNSRYNWKTSRNTYIHGALHNIVSNMLRKHHRLAPDTLPLTTTTPTHHSANEHTKQTPPPSSRSGRPLTPQAYRVALQPVGSSLSPLCTPHV